MNKVYMAVIGDPIEHSFSPIIHETVLKELDIDYDYKKLHVKRGCLAEFFKSLDKDKMTGFNVTMPHKTDIIEYMDYMSEDAVKFNAVNTVKVKNGKFYGYNTDAEGFVRSVSDMGYSFQDKRVVILGAGGVSSTLCLKLSSMAGEIIVANRNVERAEEIATRVSLGTYAKIKAEKMNISTLDKVCRGADILINATPLGMTGISEDYENFEFLSVLNADALVCDLIYNPKKTRLLGAAEEKGFGILNGLGMLIYQGLLADEIFLEKTLDFKALYKKIADNSEKIKK